LSAFSAKTFALIMMALILVPIIVSLVYSWGIWRKEQKGN